MLALAITAGGCGNTVRVYSGSARPGGEIARIHNTPSAVLVAVDGRKVEIVRYPHARPEILYEILPGQHQIEVGHFRDMQDRVDATSTIDYDFAAGRQYSFVVQEFVSEAKHTWFVTLIDYETGRRVAEPGTPLPQSRPKSSSPPLDVQRVMGEF